MMALPLLLAADDGVAKQRNANRQRLEKMPFDERQRLEDNYQTFQSLSDDEQTRLRKLQTAIEKDSNLKAAFEEYQRWAESLSPVQRSELRRETDPQARLRLIEEMRRSPPPEDHGFPFEGFERSAPPDRMQLIRKVIGPIRIFDQIPSSSHDATLLIDVLEKMLPAERQKEFQDYDPFTRKVRVLRDTIQRNKTLGPLQRLTGPQETEVTNKLIDALDDGSPAKQFAISKRGPEQRMAVMGVLIRGLISELMLAIDVHFPSPEALRQFEAKLSRSEKELTDKLPPADRMVQLQQKYLEDRVPGIREFHEITLELQSILSESLRSRPPFFRPGQGGPGDPMRRPDRGFEGDRRPGQGDDDRRPRPDGENDRPKDRRPDSRPPKPSRDD